MVNCLSLIVMVISRKVVDLVSGSTFHFRDPNWLRVGLKVSHCIVGSVRVCIEFSHCHDLSKCQRCHQ